jgi:DNA-directed RNA polymerase specialized sigma24 family protein
MLQIPPGTVMSRISRGRQMLFDALKSERTPKPVKSHARLQEA